MSLRAEIWLTLIILAVTVYFLSGFCEFWFR